MVQAGGRRGDRAQFLPYTASGSQVRGTYGLDFQARLAHHCHMDVRRFPDMEAMSRFAADLVGRAVAGAVAQRGRCALALAGGSTPRRTHGLLAAMPGLPWHAVHVFFGDERCVPPDDPASNLAMARETLLDHVPLPPGNLHPMDCSSGAVAGAAGYQAGLDAFFNGPPSFDLVMLGMGADGHTASLFPSRGPEDDTGRWVTAVPGGLGNPPVARVSLTLAALNTARLAVFLVSGPAKLALMDAMAADPAGAARRWPAARVRPDAHGAGRVIWCAVRT